MRLSRHLKKFILAGVFGLLGLGVGVGIAAAQDDDMPPPPLAVLISVADQRLVLLRDGGVIAKYPISTSRFGIGDNWGSYKTPVGKLRVYNKIGDDLTPGAVIKHRSATGEVLAVNAPGRDPIVTRVIWLEGTEDQNSHARARGIYIHGTPEENTIGRPVSWGCIRMRSEDVIALYEQIPVGTEVDIVADKLPRLHKYKPPQPPPSDDGGQQPSGSSGLLAKLLPWKSSKPAPPAPTALPPPAVAEKPRRMKKPRPRRKNKPLPPANRIPPQTNPPRRVNRNLPPQSPVPHRKNPPPKNPKKPIKLASHAPQPHFSMMPATSGNDDGNSKSASAANPDAIRAMQGSILTSDLPH